LAQGYVEFLATYQPLLTGLQTWVAKAWTRQPLFQPVR
jgi:hypothetical protein